MGKFNPIKASGEVVTASMFNELQQAIQIAFAPDTGGSVQAHDVTGNYTVTDQDQILLADPIGGPVNVILPVPSKRQQITVLNVSGTSANAVTIKRIDGKSMGQSGTSQTVDKLKGLIVVCDAKDWFPVPSVE